MAQMTGRDLYAIFWGEGIRWDEEAPLSKERWEAVAAKVNRHTEAEVERGHIAIRVTERSVYNALRNLLVNTYGMSRDTVVTEITKTARAPEAIREWLDGQNVRTFIGQMVREAVRDLATQLIREEARAAINGKIKITLEGA